MVFFGGGGVGWGGWGWGGVILLGLPLRILAWSPLLLLFTLLLSSFFSSTGSLNPAGISFMSQSGAPAH